MGDRRPLELTIYPAQDGHAGVDEPDCLVCRADDARDAKHLTEAELAAEYWSAACEGALELAGEIEETDAPIRALTLRRFATLPHYDD